MRKVTAGDARATVAAAATVYYGHDQHGTGPPAGATETRER